MNRRPAQPAAFTLIELLVVIGLITTLAALSVPAFSHMVKAAALSNAGFSVIDQLNLARQTALSRNCSVQVRFYRLPDDTGTGSPADYRAVQIFLDDGRALEPLGKPVYFPSRIIIAPNPVVSSIMDDTMTGLLPETAPEPGDPGLGEYGGNYRYRAFYFKPGGATDLPDSQNRLVFFSLINKTDQLAANGLPANYLTIQIEASTGRVKSYRP
jgi:uncharacterized protein (TIGR02596 family)